MNDDEILALAGEEAPPKIETPRSRELDKYVQQKIAEVQGRSGEPYFTDRDVYEMGGGDFQDGGPTTDIDAASRHGILTHFPGLIGRAVLGPLQRRIDPERHARVERFIHEWKPDTPAEQFTESAVGLASEAPTLFMPAGAVTGTALRGAVGAAGERYLAGTLARQVGTKALESGLMFGAADVAREGARQAAEGYFTPEELAKAGASGFVTGTALGPASSIPGALVRIPAEAASMAVAGAALEGRHTTATEVGSNLVLFTALAALHGGGEKAHDAMARTTLILRSMKQGFNAGRNIQRIKQAASGMDEGTWRVIDGALAAAQAGDPRMRSLMELQNEEVFKAGLRSQMAVTEARESGDAAALERAQAEAVTAEKAVQEAIGTFRRDLERMVLQRDLRQSWSTAESLQVQAELEAEKQRNAAALEEERASYEARTQELAARVSQFQMPAGEPQPGVTMRPTERGTLTNRPGEPGPIRTYGVEPTVARSFAERMVRGPVESGRPRVIGQDEVASPEVLEFERQELIRDSATATGEQREEIARRLAEIDRQVEEQRILAPPPGPEPVDRMALAGQGDIERLRGMRAPMVPGEIPKPQPRLTRDQMPHWIPKESRATVRGLLREQGYRGSRRKNLSFEEQSWLYYQATGRLPEGTEPSAPTARRPAERPPEREQRPPEREQEPPKSEQRPAETPREEKPPELTEDDFDRMLEEEIAASEGPREPSKVEALREVVEDARAAEKDLLDNGVVVAGTEATRTRIEAERQLKEAEREEKPTVAVPLEEKTEEPKKSPESERSFVIYRGANGGVRVVFPDRNHADLYAAMSRQKKAAMGKSAPPADLKGLATRMGFDVNDMLRHSTEYRKEIDQATKDLPAGSRYEADYYRDRRNLPKPSEGEKFTMSYGGTKVGEFTVPPAEKPPAPKFGEDNKLVTKSEVDELTALINKKLKGVFSFPGPIADPEVARAVAKIGLYYLEGLARQVGRVAKEAWAKLVSDHFDGRIKPETIDWLWERKPLQEYRARLEQKGTGRGENQALSGGVSEGQPGSERGPPSPRKPAGAGERPEVPGGAPAPAKVGEVRGGGGPPRVGQGSGGRGGEAVPGGGKDSGVQEHAPGVRQARRSNVRLPLSRPVELTPSERRKANDAAIALVESKRPEDMTPEDIEILRRYTGEGGLNDKTTGGAGLLTEFYTSYEVVDWTWKMLDRMGWKPRKGAKVLEPSSGIGNFVGLGPEDLNWTMIEREGVSSKIARALYPQAEVRNETFQDLTGREGTYDLVITNPPFLEFWSGKTVPGAQAYRDIRTLHDMFLVKGLDQLRPGGMLVFVTTTGSMDKIDTDGIRRRVAGKADLVGAYRLPSGVMDANSDFKGPVDVLFFQRVNDRELSEMPSWIEATTDLNGARYNKYFHENPHHVAGEIEAGYGQQFAGQIGVRSDRAKPYTKYLEQWLDRAPKIRPAKDFRDETPKESVTKAVERPADAIDLPGDVWPGQHFVKDGKLFVGEAEWARRWTGNPDMEKKLVEVAAISRGLNRLTDALKRGDAIDGHAAQGIVSGMLERYMDKFGNPAEDRALFDAMADDPWAYHIRELVGLDGRKSALLTDGGIFKNPYQRSKVDPSDISQVAADVRAREGGLVDPAVVFTRYKGKEFESAQDVVAWFKSRPEWNIRENGLYEHDSDYLYGDIRGKLEEARRIGQTGQAKKLSAVMPKSDPEDVVRQRVTITDPWIPAETVTGFIQWFLGRNFKVSKAFDSWGRDRGSRSPRMYDLKINNIHRGYQIEATPENIKRYGRLADGKFHHIDENWNDIVLSAVNGRKFQLARNEKGEVTRTAQEARAINDFVVAEVFKSFERYLKESPRESEGITRTYNEKFRSWRTKTYPDTIEIDGFSRHHFERIHPWQSRFYNQANDLGRAGNATETGGGKTLALILVGQGLKQSGMANKVIYTVQPGSIEKWKTEYQLAFPAARILDLGNLSFAKGNIENTRRILARASLHDYDAYFVTREGQGRIPMSPAYREAYYTQMLDRLEKEVSEAEEGSYTEREAEKIKERIKAMIEEIKAEAAENAKAKEAGVKSQALYFDELGFDALIVDEAHEYKNVAAIGSKTAGMLSIGQAGSQRADDMAMKARWILEKNGNRNVFLATATPSPNQPSDMYNVMNLVAPDAMERHGINSLESFLRNFIETDSIEVTDAAGRPRDKQVVVGMKNLNDFRSIFHRYFYIRTQEQLRDDFPDYPYDKPAAARKTVFLEISPATKAQVGMIIGMANQIEAMTDQKAKRAARSRLNAYARNVSVGPGIMEPQKYQDYRDPNFKGERIANDVARNYHELVANPRRPKAGKQGPDLNGHLVFLDVTGQTASGRETMDENYHEWLKKRLVELGVPEDQIAVVNSNSNNSRADKQHIQRMYNAGRIRVLIGSTGSMGVSIDLQKITTHIYNWNQPWNPEMYRQRMGRGVRQGNLGEQVEVLDYLTNQTFDARVAQINFSKEKFLVPLLFGTADRVENRLIDADADFTTAMIAEMLKPGRADLEVNEKAYAHEFASANLHRARESQVELEDKIKKLDEEIEERRARITRLTRMKAESKTEGAYQGQIDSETEKVSNLEQVRTATEKQLKEAPGHIKLLEQMTEEAQSAVDRAVRIKNSVEAGSTYGEAKNMEAFRAEGLVMPANFAFRDLFDQVRRLANESSGDDLAIAAEQVFEGNLGVLDVMRGQATPLRQAVEKAWKQLYGEVPSFQRPNVSPSSVGAAAAKDFERSREAFDDFVARQAQHWLESGEEINPELRGILQTLAKRTAPKKALTDTALDVPKEGRDLSPAEVAAITRFGQAVEDKHRLLGQPSMKGEEFEKLTRGEKMVHLTRRVRAAKDPRHIDAILRSEKYNVYKMPDADVESLLVVVGDRMRSIEVRNWPRHLREAAFRIEQGEQPGIATGRGLAMGEPEKHIFGLLPARTALKGTGIVEAVRPAWERLKGEWNLWTQYAKEQLFRDDRGRSIKHKGLDDRIIFELLNNTEGDARWLDRPEVTLQDGTKHAPKDWHREKAKEFAEIFEELRRAQGLPKVLSRRYYVTHLLDRLLAFERATTHDLERIHALAKLKVGDYDMEKLAELLPRGMSRAKALQVIDRMVSARAPRSMKQAKRAFASILAADERAGIPNELYQPFLKERRGATPYHESIYMSFEAYLRYAMRKVHIEPAVDAIRPMVESMQGAKGGTILMTQRGYAEKYIDHLLGRPSNIDVRLEGFLESIAKMTHGVPLRIPIIRRLFDPRPATRLTTAILRVQYLRLLGLAVDSALRNITQGVNTLVKYGLRDTVKGYARLALDPRVRKLIHEERLLQDFEGFFRGPEPFYSRPLSKVEKLALWPFSFAEFINRGAAFAAGLESAKRQGLSFERGLQLGYTAANRYLAKVRPEEARRVSTTSEAIEYARKGVVETQFGYTPAESSPGFSTPLGRLAFQFFQYPTQQMAFLWDTSFGKPRSEWGSGEFARSLALLGLSLFGAQYLASFFGKDVSDMWSFWGIVPRSPGPNVSLALDLWSAMGGDKFSQLRLKQQYGSLVSEHPEDFFRFVRKARKYGKGEAVMPYRELPEPPPSFAPGRGSRGGSRGERGR